MSHGGGGNNDSISAEPNLTPMLDMVLQLVMFFIVCADFVQANLDNSIKLPVVPGAKMVEKDTSNFIYLNISSEGHLLIPKAEQIPSEDGSTPASRLETFLEIGAYLKRKSKAAADPTKKIIVIRADATAQFSKVFGLMKECRRAGFENLQMRVLLAGK